MEQNEIDARKAFLKALAAAQGEFQPIAKNRDVTIRPREAAAYTFRYADLEEIVSKTRPALAKNGLSLRTVIAPDGERHWRLTSILAHAEGHEDVSEAVISSSGDIKQLGAAITYMRRYLVVAQLGVAADDDLDVNGKGAGDDQPQQPSCASERRSVPADELEPRSRPTEEGHEPPAHDPAASRAGEGRVAPISEGQQRWLTAKLTSKGFDDEQRDELFARHKVRDLSVRLMTQPQFDAIKSELNRS